MNEICVEKEEFVLHNIENLGSFSNDLAIKEKKTRVRLLSFSEMQKSASDLNILDFTELLNLKL